MRGFFILALFALLFSLCTKDQYWGNCKATINDFEWIGESRIIRKNDSLFHYNADKSGFGDDRIESVGILNVPLKVGSYPFNGGKSFGIPRKDMFGIYTVLAGGDLIAGIYEMKKNDSENFIEVIDASGKKISGRFNMRLYLDTIQWPDFKDVLQDSIIIENAEFTAKFD